MSLNYNYYLEYLWNSNVIIIQIRYELFVWIKEEKMTCNLFLLDIKI